jgi:hypothetical protein
VKQDTLASYADALFEEVQEKYDRKVLRKLQVDAYSQLLKNQD